MDAYIGSGADDITWWQMSVRAVLVFLFGVGLMRVTGGRAFGKNTMFDTLLAIIVGSILSRTITGNSRFLPTLAAAGTLVLVHMLLAAIAYRSHAVGNVVKGRALELVRDGVFQRDVMRRASITEHDIEEAMRLAGGPVDVRQLRSAHLERNGSISVVSDRPDRPDRSG